jgi:hypothetical protein
MQSGYKFSRSECPVCGESVADNWYIRHMNTEHPLNLPVFHPPHPDGAVICVDCKREPVVDRPSAKVCRRCAMRRFEDLLFPTEPSTNEKIDAWLIWNGYDREKLNAAAQRIADFVRSELDELIAEVE